MMRDVYLHGAAGRTFGRRFRLDVQSPAEAVRALMMLRPGLRAVLRAGWWRVVVGPPRIRNGVTGEQLNMLMGSQPLHLVPATPPQGGGQGKNIGSIILGTVLIIAGALSYIYGFTAVAAPSLILTGISMVAGGVAGLLTTVPTPTDPSQQAAPDDRPSFLFNGVVNNSQQGVPVPLIFGRHLTGSIVVAAGLTTEDMDPLANSGDGPPPDGKPGLPISAFLAVAR
jgi:predicted phage tail protein